MWAENTRPSTLGDQKISIQLLRTARNTPFYCSSCRNTAPMHVNTSGFKKETTAGTSLLLPSQKKKIASPAHQTHSWAKAFSKGQCNHLPIKPCLAFFFFQPNKVWDTLHSRRQKRPSAESCNMTSSSKNPFTHLPRQYNPQTTTPLQ